MDHVLDPAFFPDAEMNSISGTSDNSRIKAHIVRAFGAAHDYDRYALVQRRVATDLAERIATIALPPEPRICEIGCGTGFLGAALTHTIPRGEFLLTDLAPTMIERARSRLGANPRFRFAVVDGEHPAALEDDGPFDLICSSLAVQWFFDLKAGLERLFAQLRPGGSLLVSTLTQGTFAEWEQAHAAAGLTPAFDAYPCPAELRAMQLDRVMPRVDVWSVTEKHRDGWAFLRSLKAIGAHATKHARHPLTPSQLRRVVERFDAGDARITYCMATCLYSKPAHGHTDVSS